MKVAEQYVNAMNRGDLNACIRIEKEHGLYGYPPELVSIGLAAHDEGRDPGDAIDDYTDIREHIEAQEEIG